MEASAQTRKITSLRIICETAEDMGIPKFATLKGTGLSEDDLYNAELQVSLDQEFLAIDNFSNEAGRIIGLGTAVSNRLHVNAFGIWGFAILTSPTLRAAMQTAVDYATLSSLTTKIELHETIGSAHFQYKTHGMPDVRRAFVLERHAGVTMTFVREVFQDPSYNNFAIKTMLPQASYGDELQNLIGVEVIGDSDIDALVLDPAALERELPKSDPVTLRYCLQQCDALLLDKANQLPPWSQKVQNAVSENIGEEQKIEDVAAQLLVTERTLRRRLTEEKTSFREIYQDTRLSIAHELLSETGLTVDAASWRVGYSEPASFARAFAKKFGHTPGELRREPVA